jgi:hypothetical protein
VAGVEGKWTVCARFLQEQTLLLVQSTDYSQDGCQVIEHKAEWDSVTPAMSQDPGEGTLRKLFISQIPED